MVSGTKKQHSDQISTQIELDHIAKDYAATSPDVPRKDHRFHQWVCVELAYFVLLEENLSPHAKWNVFFFFEAQIFQVFFHKLYSSKSEEEFGCELVSAKARNQ